MNSLQIEFIAGLQKDCIGRTFQAEVIMRLLSGLCLIVAVLALVLWWTARIAGSLSLIVAALFLVLFIISLFFRKGHPDEL
jgi:membrane protein YdbS with pleckstrin-like domain